MGSVVRCPGCQVRLVVAGPPARDDQDGDRPRGQVPAEGRFPVWAAALFGVLLFGVVGGGVYYAIRVKGGANDGPAADRLPGGGVRYVPRKSEERYRKLQTEKGDARLTAAEVLATMGEPTSRRPLKVVDSREPGASVYIERWEWKVPGSGTESSMILGNGLVQSPSVRLEVTPGDAPPPRPARPEGAEGR